MNKYTLHIIALFAFVLIASCGEKKSNRKTLNDSTNLKHDFIFGKVKIHTLDLTYGIKNLFPFPIVRSDDSTKKEEPQKDNTQILVRIKNDSLWYYYAQQTSKYSEIDKSDDYIDTVWVYDSVTKYTEFRPNSIDSIIKIVKHINPDKYETFSNDTLFDSNMDIMDGGEIIINLKYDKIKKLRIELGNTFDSTALQIVNVINPYLPKEHKLDIPYGEWKEAIASWKQLDSINK